MTRPAVSVLIPTYNRAQLLPECLDSVLEQTVRPAQVIVINDGSSDNTSLVASPYKGRIEYIETENRGKSAALNTGLPRVNGDYVWIFDDDNVALPDALERFVQALEPHPEYGFAYSPFYISRTRGNGAGVEVEKLWPMPKTNEDDFVIRLMESNFLSGSAIFARAACYRDVGPFREDLIRSQDYEMAIRLSRRYRGIRVESPTFHSRQHEGTRGSSLDSFSPARKFEKWREYDRKFFRELRQELNLREYLPRRPGKEELSPLDTRRAYLQRMTIMTPKGLYDEMIEDLGLALAQEAGSSGLSEAERLLITRALSYVPAGEGLFAGWTVVGRVKALCPGRALGREVLFESLRGIFWRICYAWKSGSRAQALRFVLTFIRLAGFRGALQALSYELTRPARVHGETSKQP